MAFWRVLNGVFVALSPFVLYFAVTHEALSWAAWLVVAWLAVRTVPVVLAAAPEHRRAALPLPLVALGFAVLGAISQTRVLLLLMPSLTQLGFAWVFARTLREGQTPLVEHFARMQKANLDGVEVAYCRRVTWMWALALTIAALVGVLLAVWGPAWVWAAFAGAGAYVFVASLFAVEYVVRAVRFRRYGDSALQRFLQRTWPSPPPTS